MIDIVLQPARKGQGAAGIRQEEHCAQLMAHVYQKYAIRHGWEANLNIVNEHGTYQLNIVDRRAYGKLQFESGLHRIQRVSFDETEQNKGVLTSLIVVTLVFYPFTFKIDTTGLHLSPIRTYNFPRQCVTDHRLEISLLTLPSILEGDLDPLIDVW